MNLYGFYRGCEDVVNILVEDKDSVAFTNGLNGDGSDEFVISGTLNSLIKEGFMEKYKDGVIIVGDESWDVIWDRCID